MCAVKDRYFKYEAALVVTDNLIVIIIIIRKVSSHKFDITFVEQLLTRA